MYLFASRSRKRSRKRVCAIGLRSPDMNLPLGKYLYSVSRTPSLFPLSHAKSTGLDAASEPRAHSRRSARRMIGAGVLVAIADAADIAPQKIRLSTPVAARSKRADL